jgi:hypothetical protein
LRTHGLALRIFCADAFLCHIKHNFSVETQMPDVYCKLESSLCSLALETGLVEVVVHV